MSEQNQAVTLDAVRREIADVLARRDRAAREARDLRRRELDAETARLDGVIMTHVGVGWMAFAACWLVCDVLASVLAGGRSSELSPVATTFVSFGLWLAGAALYARRAFGPGGDGEDRA